MAELKKNPTWRHQELKGPVRVTLKTAKPVASGKSKVGEWNLWPVFVDKNAKCYDRQTEKLIPDYEGEATCFPPTGLHKSFMEATNGTKEGVVVEISVEGKLNKDGKPYKEYVCKVVKEGVSPPNSLSHQELKFLESFRHFIEKKVVEGTKDDFIGWAKSDTYGFKDDATIEKMWNVYCESKKV